MCAGTGDRVASGPAFTSGLDIDTKNERHLVQGERPSSTVGFPHPGYAPWSPRGHRVSDTTGSAPTRLLFVTFSSVHPLQPLACVILFKDNLFNTYAESLMQNSALWGECVCRDAVRSFIRRPPSVCLSLPSICASIHRP